MFSRIRRTGPVRAVLGALLACAAGLALSGCGLKGPLYLPSRGGKVVTRPPQPRGADDTTPDGKAKRQDERAPQPPASP